MKKISDWTFLWMAFLCLCKNLEWFLLSVSSWWDWDFNDLDLRVLIPLPGLLKHHSQCCAKEPALFCCHPKSWNLWQSSSFNRKLILRLYNEIPGLKKRHEIENSFSYSWLDTFKMKVHPLQSRRNYNSTHIINFRIPTTSFFVLK